VLRFATLFACTHTCTESPEKAQKQGKQALPELSQDLAEIVAVWPELPEHIKAAIKALIQTHKAETK
jgi:hypothetical protein